MENGFFHPDRGYWQTNSEPSAEIIATYPAGTVRVPLKPGDGYDWDGSAWIAQAPSAPSVPQKVTRRQARQALLLAGKLGLVQPAIDTIADPVQRQMVQIEWDDSQDFERERPSLVALASQIGLSSQELDALFIQAAQLP